MLVREYETSVNADVVGRLSTVPQRRTQPAYLIAVHKETGAQRGIQRVGFCAVDISEGRMAVCSCEL